MEFLVTRSSVFFVLVISVFCLLRPARSDDAQALLALKSSIDALSKLPWQGGGNVCEWQGVKECFHGRVSKLVLEYLNLTGSLDSKILNQLDQLRVLSFKGNLLSGEIPDLSGLINLKSIFLNDNNFSGVFPASVSDLHRVKVVVFAGNRISGEIPASLLKLRRLYMLYLHDNLFTGPIPAFNQTSLRYLNVSNNQLSGEIPLTPELIRFNASSFSGNPELCGEQIQNPCQLPPSTSPSYPTIPKANARSSSASSNRTKLIKIVAGTVGGFVLLLICLLLLWMNCRNWMKRKASGHVRRSKGVSNMEGEGASGTGGEEGGGGSGSGGKNGGKQGGFSWEDKGLGKLVFCGAGDQEMTYGLEDLLKASAETLGRGSMGSTYKAVMESGFIVTVKRLKDARYPGLEEFRRHMGLLGRLRHPNLVPLRAYFQAKEERLLVYDYFPNGSLFSLIHGISSNSITTNPTIYTDIEDSLPEQMESKISICHCVHFCERYERKGCLVGALNYAWHSTNLQAGALSLNVLREAEW